MTEKGTAPISDFSKEPLIVFKEGHCLRDVLDRILEKEVQQHNTVLETKVHSLAIAMTKEGMGGAVLLRKSVNVADGVVVTSFEPALYMDFVLAW